MNYANLYRPALQLGLTAFLAVGTPALMSSQAFAGSNMEKVDIVQEGIDLKPLYVGANSSGYTGTENEAHKFMVRVYAKAKGQNRVYEVAIHANYKGTILFKKNVGKTEGWATYGKSHELWAKPRDLKWLTVPVEVCKQNMAKMIAAGKSKAQVLANDRKVTAHTQIYFTAYADSKGNNKKGKHTSSGGIEPHNDNMVYSVPVVCRAAL